MNESCLSLESCHTHMNEPHSVSSLFWFMAHTWMSCHTHMKWMSHMDESHEWVMTISGVVSHTYEWATLSLPSLLTHDTHMHESCLSHRSWVIINIYFWFLRLCLPLDECLSELVVQLTALCCNSLQHTATHCNTLPHTATHCKHTATHCNTLQHTATRCNTHSYKVVSSIDASLFLVLANLFVSIEWQTARQITKD